MVMHPHQNIWFALLFLIAVWYSTVWLCRSLINCPLTGGHLDFPLFCYCKQSCVAYLFAQNFEYDENSIILGFGFIGSKSIYI